MEARVGTFAIYKGQEYVAAEDYASGKIVLYSKSQDDLKLGFAEFSKGNYKLVVSKGELETALYVTTYAQYCGSKFQLDLLQDGKALLVHSGVPGNVEQLGFQFVEPYVFEKWVPLEELESVFEEKKPIWGFTA